MSDQLQFDISGTAYTLSGQPMGLFDMQFMMDPATGEQQFLNAPSGCMSGLNVSGASFSNVNMTLNGQSVMSGSVTGAYSGGDLQDAAMQFTNGASTFTWEMGAGSSSCVAGDTPIQTMLLGEKVPGEDSALTSATSYLALNIQHVSVQTVSLPEPAMIGLFVLGLIFVLLKRGSHVIS